MALNPYFNKFGSKSELNLQEQLFIEFVQINGMDVLYLPKVYLSEDLILNEVIDHYHSKGMMIEMLLESYEDWENNSIELGNFGITQMANEAVFVVSKLRFEEVVCEERLSFGNRPNEGDLLWSPNLQEFFKIKKVNKDDPTKTKDRWILKCEKYDSNSEISIDLTDNIHDAGTFDPNFDNGKSNYIPITDEVEQFLNEFGNENEIDMSIDPDKNAIENAKDIKTKQIKQSINKENPNLSLINLAKDIIKE